MKTLYLILNVTPVSIRDISSLNQTLLVLTPRSKQILRAQASQRMIGQIYITHRVMESNVEREGEKIIRGKGGNDQTTIFQLEKSERDVKVWGV